MTAEQNQLVCENFGLVHACARRYMGRGIDYDDLYQSGCEGLVKAAAGFDKSRNICFSTYAVPAILGEMRRLFRDGGSVRVSRSIRELGLKIRRVESEMHTELGHEPTVTELAARLGCDTESIVQAMDASQPVLSLTIQDSEEPAFERALPSEAFDDSLIDTLALRQVIAQLSEADRSIIELRYFHNQTQSQTARMLGMTQVQISRREKKLLTEIKKMLFTK